MNHIPSNVATSIRAFVKNIVKKSIFKDISALLEPCCQATFTFDAEGCGTGEYAQGVEFTGCTITCTKLAGKTALMWLVSTEHDGGATQYITFDSDGVWTGDIQTSWENSDGTETIKIYLQEEGQRVTYTTEEQDVEVNTCD